MTTKTRAISQAQKQKRRSEILAVASQMFAIQSFSRISMDDIARTAGLAKGTLYLYFPTKETLFLALLEERFTGWFQQMNAGLDLLSEASTEAVVSLMVEVLTCHPEFPRLIAISHAILEQNVEARDLLRYKALLFEGVAKSGRRLETCLGLAPGRGAELLLAFYALVTGYQQLADPGPQFAAALTALGEDLFHIDYRQTLETAFKTYLHGLGAA